MARQYSGTAGRVENCQVGVFLAHATANQHLLIDRELYIPQEWFKDRARCVKAGIPESVVFKTKPQLAQDMLEGAFKHGINPAYVVGDQVYGGAGLRTFLEQKQCGYVVGIASNYQVYIDTTPYKVNELCVREDTWHQLSAGKGSKGGRYYEWQLIEINGINADGWGHWVLFRRNIKNSDKVSYYIVYARRGSSIEELAKVAGSRWIIETSFATSKGEVGLDHYQVRSCIGWYRHITLCLVSLLFLEGMRKEFVEIEQEKKGRNQA